MQKTIIRDFRHECDVYWRYNLSNDYSIFLLRDIFFGELQFAVTEATFLLEMFGEISIV